MGEITNYTKLLIKELDKRGIGAKPEYFDGHKSVDLFIEEANLIIEVDGSHHSTNPEQALADLKRAKYSLENGCITFHLPNTLIYKYTSESADLIKAMVTKLKNKKINSKTIKSEVIPKQPKVIIEEKLREELKSELKSEIIKEINKSLPSKNTLNPIPNKTNYQLRMSKKKRLYIIISILFLAFVIYAIVINNNPSEESDNNLIIYNSTPAPNQITAPELVSEPESIIVEGTKTDVLITNNLADAISLNVTYRIYSKWFGTDSTTSQVFDVGANSRQSFEVYNNDGCSTAPCYVSIIDYNNLFN